MEKQNDSKQNCDCGPDCCTPKKKNKLWMKLLFILIILAAVAIITVKLAGKNHSEANVTKDTVNVQQTAGCCDTTGIKTCVKVCNPSQGCCPQSKK